MKTYTPVTGKSRGRWTCWLLAVGLAGLGGLACASSPPKPAEPKTEKPSHLVCPNPRDESACTPGPGLGPEQCELYREDEAWLPPAYVQNATCVCKKAPNDPTSICAHKLIQDQTKAQPDEIKEQGRLCNSKKGLERDECFEKYLTPVIYQIHVKAYEKCCCPCGPSSYETWKAITVIPLESCDLASKLFDLFGSCHGTPGKW